MLGVLPWLVGFQPAAVSDRADPAVDNDLREWRARDEACVASAYGGLRIDDGERQILASYTQGLVMLDHDRHLMAQTPGFPCGGSADELVGLEIGDAWIGTPLIALGATIGGRNENRTWLALYRVGDNGELVPTFVGEVERHTGHTTCTGTVTIIPGGLVYTDPDGSATLWIYDREAGIYRTQLPAPTTV